MAFPYRQVHLDFHTAGDIPEVGSRFDAEEFKRTLTDACVDSITCFAVCHHGYSYYPTKVGVMHPTLKFDLLGAQLKACKEADIRTQIYISAGANEVAAVAHPEWRVVYAPGEFVWSNQGLLEPGFHGMCFNTDYLDYLCRLTQEALSRYKSADGVFFDIILPFGCCCPKCQRDMFAQGLDPRDKEDLHRFARQVLQKYYDAMNGAVRAVRPDIDVIHNSGNTFLNMPEFSHYYSHWEIESLPTGGWGYDHFPLSAGAARQTGKPYAGMTGKFHASWGEFGGIKHPNALRYECAAMLAQGARCNIGDQLHPCGKLDETTYRVIGAAFKEVKAKEEYCLTARNRTEIAMISAEACHLPGDSDIGLSRLLLESHFLFDNLTPEMDFSDYKLVIFPEGFQYSAELAPRLEALYSKGGKALFCGESLRSLPSIPGVEIGKCNSLTPTYILPEPALRPDFVATPFVIYGSNLLLKADAVAGVHSLGDVYEPYYNRDLKHFCSHAQTPNRLDASGYSLGVATDHAICLAYPFFSIYRKNGSAAERQFLAHIIAMGLNNQPIVSSNLASCARVTVTDDAVNKREIVHLLYAPMLKRGDGVEIIEDLLPLHNVQLAIQTNHAVKSVELVPEHRALEYTVQANRVCFNVDSFVCHAMIALHYES